MRSVRSSRVGSKSKVAARRTLNLEPATSIFRFQFKGLYPALEEASQLSPSLRVRLEHLVGEVDCSTCDGSRLAGRCGGRAVSRPHRSASCASLPLGELLAARSRPGSCRPASRRSPANWSARSPAGCSSCSMWGSNTCRSAGRRRRSPTARPSEFAWPASSAAACAACCTCSTSRRSACIRATTRGCSRRLQKLRDLGNTLLVVEHDREVIENCDHVLDFGPGAGRLGGQIVADATPDKLGKAAGSVTGPYLSGKKAIAVPANAEGSGSSRFRSPRVESRRQSSKSNAATFDLRHSDLRP